VSMLHPMHIVVVLASTAAGAPENPLNLPPPEGEVDFFAEAMRFPLPNDDRGGAASLTLREGRGGNAPTTLGSLRPAELEGTPASLETSNESVEVYHFSILADRFMAAGDAAAALRLLANAESIAPGNPSVLERLARANEAAGDLPRALTWWSMLELMFPDDAEVRAARIRCLLLAGRAGEARVAAEAAGRVAAPRRHLLCRFTSMCFACWILPSRRQAPPRTPCWNYRCWCGGSRGRNGKWTSCSARNAGPWCCAGC
jgi:tetratricopeptide (TPR) repeat protein